MSYAPAGPRGVSTAQLVIFILVILGAGVASYVFYTEASRLNAEKDKETEKLKAAERGLTEARAKLDQFYEAIGYTSLDQIKQAFEGSKQFPVDPRKLEKLIETKIQKRDDLRKQIGVDPKDVDETGQSKFLEQTITAGRRAGAVPDNLKSSRVGNLIDQLIRRDKALAAREDVVTQGEAAVAAVDLKIADKNAEIKKKFAEMDDKAAQTWKERTAEQDKLRFEPITWAAERADRDKILALEQSIGQKLDLKLKAQRDPMTPVDGKITAYDWRTRRGTVDLGARDNVKAGYEFDIFTTRPGPERPDKRLQRGRIRLLNVYPDTSLFVALPSEYESEDKPIMEGNYVCSQLYDQTTRKKFAIQGWFPKGGNYSKESIAGLIDRYGGIVQDALALDTDYLVIGVADDKNLTNPSEEAKAAVAEGKRAYEDARHWYVTVLTVDKFFKYMDRMGTKAAP